MSIRLKHGVWLGLMIGGALGASASGTAEPPDIGTVLERLRPEHPRLFLNRDSLEQVRRDGLAPDQQAWLRELRKRADEPPEPPAAR